MGLIIPNYNKRTYCDDNFIIYRPKEDKPLVQKDKKIFNAWVEPLPKEYEFKITWSLIARDYNAEGELKVIVKPKYEDEYIDVIVDSKEGIKANEILEIKSKKKYL